MVIPFLQIVVSTTDIPYQTIALTHYNYAITLLRLGYQHIDNKRTIRESLPVNPTITLQLQMQPIKFSVAMDIQSYPLGF